jgi:hypothetical protein|tara:strand:+ start:349 stop:579 length:231 start_codon:yes stop_codon:yes gene_type:complete
MKLSTLAKKYEAASKNLVKFNDKADNAKTEISLESNQCKAEKWAAIMLDLQFKLEEYSIEELKIVSNKYRTLLELI